MDPAASRPTPHDIDTRLVRTFAAVARERSFTQAAVKLGLTQQGVSNHIRKLESLLQYPVFERHHSHVVLTAQGIRLLPYAHAVMVATDNLLELSLSERSPIRVAEIRGRKMMQDCWKMYRRTNPRQQVVFHDMLSVEQIQAVLEGRLDVGMGRLMENIPGVESAPLRLDALMVLSIHPLESVALAKSRLGYTGLFSDRFLGWSTFCQQLAHDFEVNLEVVPHDNTMLEAIGQGQINGELPPILALNGMRDYPDSEYYNWYTLTDVQPYYPWSLFWRKHEAREEVLNFVDVALEVAREKGWLSTDKSGIEIWIPSDGAKHLDA
ncbi:LysR family transcriptional regulator [Rhodococcoides fascians A21d2]|uniref:LysR family transcriptional regulator n=1 Tax=Rhodococcoides fascians TaxID=1828 RepID=UPI0013EF0022|nr:LysR family transcriptional regulator [Rhodococcus fascians]QII00275.1 LysR family transcriptional regulator [Rhodococcus fascians A21d2]